MADRIDDYIAALQDEINAVRTSKAYKTKLTDGQMVGNMLGNYLYNFTAARLMISDDDAPAMLEVDGTNYDCSIVFSKGMQVQIAVAVDFGETVYSAFISNDRTQIMSRLVAKFKDARAKKLDIFKLAEEVFSGKSRNLGKASARPIYAYSENNAPNSAQAEAIAASFGSTFSVIWGPPGTGKTRTIARAVEAHLNAGRRVLIASHANSAVDGALEEVAAQLKDSFYNDGKIVRLGTPKDSRLESKFPLLLASNAANRLNAHLVEERAMLLSKALPLEAEIQSCQRLQKASDVYRELEREMQRPLESSPQAVRYQQLLVEINEAQQKLNVAQNNLDKFLSRVDVVTQENQIRDLTIFIAGRQRFAAEMHAGLSRVAESRGDLDARLQAADRELDEAMLASGLTPNNVNERLRLCQSELEQIQTRLKAIESDIASGAQNVLDGAMVVGTTLTRLFVSQAMAAQTFDVLIVDESSMVSLPHLYWAISKATQAVTIVGDFKQLPPIVQADTTAANKYLRKNIFDLLDIATVDKARTSSLVSMLDVQYRMAPEIASISSKMFYGGLLSNAHSTKGHGINDTVFGANRLVLVDTSHVDPWCTSLQGGSRLNIYSAGLAVTIARRLLEEHPQMSLGFAAPYRPQAEIVAKAFAEAGFNDRAVASTVHRFQGGQSSAIIFDCVDGKGSGRSLLDDYMGEHAAGGRKSSADVLLNVGLTRAHDIFIMLVNRQYFFDNFKDSVLCRFIDQMAHTCMLMPSRQLDDNFAAGPLTDFNSSTPTMRTIDTSGRALKSVYNEKDFWPAFKVDLSSAQRSVIMLSPFMTLQRSEQFMNAFTHLLARGVKISVYTKPCDELQSHMAKEAEEVIAALKKTGVSVFERSKIHQKIVIVDDQVCWEGSLNILSHRDTREHMRRLEGAAFAEELRRSLRLD